MDVDTMKMSTRLIISGFVCCVVFMSAHIKAFHFDVKMKCGTVFLLPQAYFSSNVLLFFWRYGCIRFNGAYSKIIVRRMCMRGFTMMMTMVCPTFLMMVVMVAFRSMCGIV